MKIRNNLMLSQKDTNNGHNNINIKLLLYLSYF